MMIAESSHCHYFELPNSEKHLESRERERNMARKGPHQEKDPLGDWAMVNKNEVPGESDQSDQNVNLIGEKPKKTTSQRRKKTKSKTESEEEALEGKENRAHSQLRNLTGDSRRPEDEKELEFPEDEKEFTEKELTLRFGAPPRYNGSYPTTVFASWNPKIPSKILIPLKVLLLVGIFTVWFLGTLVDVKIAAVCSATLYAGLEFFWTRVTCGAGRGHTTWHQWVANIVTLPFGLFPFLVKTAYWPNVGFLRLKWILGIGVGIFYRFGDLMGIWGNHWSAPVGGEKEKIATMRWDFLFDAPDFAAIQEALSSDGDSDVHHNDPSGGSSVSAAGADVTAAEVLAEQALKIKTPAEQAAKRLSVAAMLAAKKFGQDSNEDGKGPVHFQEQTLSTLQWIDQCYPNCYYGAVDTEAVIWRVLGAVGIGNSVRKDSEREEDSPLSNPISVSTISSFFLADDTSYEDSANVSAQNDAAALELGKAVDNDQNSQRQPSKNSQQAKEKRPQLKKLSEADKAQLLKALDPEFSVASWILTSLVWGPLLLYGLELVQGYTFRFLYDGYNPAWCYAWRGKDARFHGNIRLSFLPLWAAFFAFMQIVNPLVLFDPCMWATYFLTSPGLGNYLQEQRP